MSKPLTLTSPEGMYRPAAYEHVAIAGDHAYVAGQVARNEAGELLAPHDAGAQAELVLANIGRILDHLGADKTRVAKLTTYLVAREDGPSVSAARKGFFGDHRPPHTGLVVAELGGPEVRVEMELVVYLG